MTGNNMVHLNIQSRQFNNIKSLLILAKIRNFAFEAVVFGAFVSWGFCLWGFCLLGVLSLGFFHPWGSVRGAFVHGASVRAPSLQLLEF